MKLDPKAIFSHHGISMVEFQSESEAKDAIQTKKKKDSAFLTFSICDGTSVGRVPTEVV